MVDLPQELVDIILEDFVGHKDLKACALTARAFLPSSQRGLFRRMSLRWESQSQRRRQGSSGRVGPAFRWELRFLCENPHLALYVRDLTLDIPKSDADQSTLEAVLRLLGNLERVAINGYGRMWDELLGSLASAILTTISLPSLRRVHLRRLTNVPHSVIFHAATSVRVLSLNRIVPQRHGDIPHDVPPNTNLEHLILPWSLTTGTLLQLCEFLLTAQDLRRLSVNAGYHFALATASSAHLRYLEVDFGGSSQPLDLPLLPVLESLTLTITMSVDAGAWFIPSNLAPTLDTLPTATPHLTVLGLTILIRALPTVPRWEDHAPFPLFENSTYRDRLPRLHVIHCSLGYWTHSLHVRATPSKPRTSSLSR